MFKNLLTFFDKGFLHWITQRMSACLLIVSIFSISLFDSLVLGFVGLLVLLVHAEAGIHTLFSDYMHDQNSKLMVNVSIDLLLIGLTKTLFLILICV